VNWISDGTTAVIDLPPGRTLPDLPTGGIETEAQLRTLPTTRVLERVGLFPGVTADVFAFQRQAVQRNLYRISLPP
jgi:hypothetical protein